MSGIFGLCYHDGRAVDPALVHKMQAAMADWGCDGRGLCLAGSVAFGQLRFFTTPESRLEGLPRTDLDTGTMFTAAGRVDNRQELGRLLKIPAEDQAQLSDGEFILRVYRRFGENSPNHIYGDWAFAAWHPVERRLFLARDHHGCTALYYHSTPTALAFASSRTALLALGLTSIEMDELYLAQVLVSWAGYYGERTIHKPIRRLPPAHCLTATPTRLDVRQYWRIEDTPELRLKNRLDYAEAFREVFDEAVRARLRAVGTVGVALSGGLDSGSVAATAAHLLKPARQRLYAFTSVPLSDTSRFVGTHFGNELPLAQATARFAGNIDLVPVDAASITPIEAIRRLVKIHNEPAHSAGNAYWILGIRGTARSHGCRVLLTGQLGNAGMSWRGEAFSQPLSFQIRSIGWRRWATDRLKRAAPPRVMFAWNRVRQRANRQWYRSSAIHPAFARRLDLLERRLADPEENWLRTALERRFSILKPGRCVLGALAAQASAEQGLETRDPSADARLLSFTLSVPDDVFIDPETGFDRWLIREAMKDRLAPEVRLNRRRGRQAGDLPSRLRACHEEVETAICELEHGPAGEYVDVPYLRETWHFVRSEDTTEAFRKAVSILTRGIMAGLFVNFQQE